MVVPSDVLSKSYRQALAASMSGCKTGKAVSNEIIVPVRRRTEGRQTGNARWYSLQRLASKLRPPQAPAELLAKEKYSVVVGLLFGGEGFICEVCRSRLRSFRCSCTARGARSGTCLAALYGGTT